MFRSIEPSQYVLFTVCGLLALALLAWGMDWIWKRRGGAPGGAGAFLFKMMEGYELSPDRRGGAASLSDKVAAPTWRSSVTDDHDGARSLVLAPARTMDVHRLRVGDKSLILNEGGWALLIAIVAAKPGEVQRAARELRHRPRFRKSAAVTQGVVVLPRHRDAIGDFCLQARAPQAAVTVSSGIHTVELSPAGVDVVMALLAATVRQCDAAASVLRMRNRVDGADWMPGESHQDRGRVLREY